MTATQGSDTLSRLCSKQSRTPLRLPVTDCNGQSEKASAVQALRHFLSSALRASAGPPRAPIDTISSTAATWVRKQALRDIVSGHVAHDGLEFNV